METLSVSCEERIMNLLKEYRKEDVSTHKKKSEVFRKYQLELLDLLAEKAYFELLTTVSKSVCNFNMSLFKKEITNGVKRGTNRIAVDNKTRMEFLCIVLPSLLKICHHDLAVTINSFAFCNGDVSVQEIQKEMTEYHYKYISDVLKFISSADISDDYASRLGFSLLDDIKDLLLSDNMCHMLWLLYDCDLDALRMDMIKAILFIDTGCNVAVHDYAVFAEVVLMYVELCGTGNYSFILQEG